MTLETFTALDMKGRMDATLDAICIGGRDVWHHKILLYQLGAFYIEVYYNKTYNFISDLIAFDSIDQLEPYLEKIEINF